MIRYSLTCDSRQFRVSTFSLLAERYRGRILKALELLYEIKFEFSALNKAHSEQIRPDLLYRQALPFCVTEETFFELNDRSSRVLAALLAGHTLALTHLDYHLDGSSPDPMATATALKMNSATAAAYSVRMIYAAGRIYDEGGGGGLFRDAFDPVSGFVVGRMHEDWCVRYSMDQLREAPRQLDEYLHSASSRIWGSGYWEVMIRGSFAHHSISPPEGLLEIARTLRCLRQVVDEIADFDDDLSAGLITTPLLFALDGAAGKPIAGEIVAAVESLWRSRTAPDGLNSGGTVLRACREMVEKAGGFAMAFEFADRIWQDGVGQCDRTIGPDARGFLALLDLKRAKLQELHDGAWRNTRMQTFFV